MDFSPDIEQFVLLCFGTGNYRQVIKLLERPAVSSPRVMRSVLFLSNGSLSMLKHYVSEAEKDVRMMLVDAEYTSGISEEPLFLRDMFAPFPDERNLGAKSCGKHPNRRYRSNAEANSHQTNSHHKSIRGSVFYLGNTQYSILDKQSTRAYVSCQRRTARSTNALSWPLMFVLEQLAESIEIAPVGFRAV